ncbi:unnamed protein product [Cuscuta epithymum]|uniref:Uncharacterized protein n=1 Tax=Cuscuta epithymum TaxID=186058 RepID=A0AAV0GH68_9ASTE|nr:unnamed protein product [Cuscuta epithymum]
MDAKNFARLKKQLAKEPKKKEAGSHKPVDEFFRKDEAAQAQIAGTPSKDAPEAGAIKTEVAKRKAPGKGVVPEGKKVKKSVSAKGEPVVLSEGHSSSGTPVVIATANAPSGRGAELTWPTENVQFSITKGTAIMHGTLNPREFLNGATPPTDKSVLSRMKDDALGGKILQASVTAALGLGELLKRLEESQAQKRQADEALAESRRQLREAREALRLEQEAFNQILENSKVIARAEGKADAERVAAEEAREALRLEQEAFNQILENSKVIARAEGKADAERVAAEEAKKVADKAEEEKREAIGQAKKDAVSEFVAGGWKSEGHKQWIASVIEESVDGWVGGPGAMWLAQKGKSYYEGGEYFTQANIYRKLARHFNVDPKTFKPEAYGLPPLQPDVRIPLPEGEERELLEDSELAKEADDEEVEDDAASRSKGGNHEAAP